jgi:hypothetical protein
MIGHGFLSVGAVVAPTSMAWAGVFFCVFSFFFLLWK